MSTVTTVQPAAIVFREEQYFDWRVYLAVGLLELLSALGLLWITQRWGHAQALMNHAWSLDFLLGIGTVLGLPMLMVVCLLHMTTVVTPREVCVWFGWIPTYRRQVSAGAIQSVEVVSYRPIADYGGWGIRYGSDGEKVLNARGDRGVRLELSDGSRLLIGSQRPEELAVAIELAIRPDLV